MIMVVWEEYDTSTNIHNIYSTDGPLTTSTCSLSYNAPQVARSPLGYKVVTRYGANNEIYLQTGNNTAINISNTSTYSQYPSVAVSNDGVIAVAWQEVTFT